MNNIIQSLWIGGRLSLLEQLSIKSFIENGHEYHLYVYDDVENIPEGTVVKDANKIIDKSQIYKCSFIARNKNYCGFADVFRIKLLLEKGSYWSDMDVVCLKHFDFEDEYVFSSELTPQKNQVTNIGVIKSPKNSPFLNEVYNHCLEMLEKNLVLSKKVWQDCIDKYNLNRYVKSYDTFCKVNFWQTNNFIKKDSKVFDTYDSNCYAAHLWNQIINREKDKVSLEKNAMKRKILSKAIMDKDKIYSTDTIYGFWQEKYF
jgi:hypothetical protein